MDRFSEWPFQLVFPSRLALPGSRYYSSTRFLTAAGQALCWALEMGTEQD